jgi:hypothetical protein
MRPEYSITNGSVDFYTMPTDAPEADGTFAWKSTSMALVRLEGRTRLVTPTPTLRLQPRSTSF